MDTITPIKLGLSGKLSGDRDYRRRFFRRQAQDEMAMSIRSLRDKRVMTQKVLGVAADMKQTAVSRIEKAEYGGWNFKTLLRVADALDARLRIVLEPAEDVIERYKTHEVAAENNQDHYAVLHRTRSDEKDTRAGLNLDQRKETALIYPTNPTRTMFNAEGIRA